MLPSYLIPYSAASSGPIHTSSTGVRFDIKEKKKILLVFLLFSFLLCTMYLVIVALKILCFSLQLNYTLNALLSINMVVALLVAFILDNTVPGTKQERGVYIWSDLRRPDIDPASIEPYKLPPKICCWFKCLRCLGP